MNTLLVYPEFPDTFWSFKHALKFVGKRSAFPPLGLLTVANLLPAKWARKTVDLNIERLHDSDIEWADIVFISAMIVQKKSARKIIDRCHNAEVKVVGGGPLFTMEPDDFTDVSHLILNEAEITLPLFLKDFQKNVAKHIYSSSGFADMAETPTPEWSLIKLKRYHSMAIQYSRGCPFNCDFCNITSLLGHKVRTKSSNQIIAELDSLYAEGWRGRVFFVDDNFIGNKKQLKNDLLPRLIDWRVNKQEITFHTEASIDLADDDALMTLMVKAGFDVVFVGIETPDAVSLAECHKQQNEGRDLVADVKKLQRAGLQVQGGFIVGFDADNSSVFQRQIDFIQNSGIVTAMVGILQAPPGTRLYKRMKEEGRITGSSSGDNVEGTTNIVPKMNTTELMKGYRSILNHIYSPRHYYKRIQTLLSEYRIPEKKTPVSFNDILAFIRSIYRLGIIEKERLHYWRLLLWTSFRKPALIPLAVNLAISGYHFRKVCEMHVR